MLRKFFALRLNIRIQPLVNNNTLKQNFVKCQTQEKKKANMDTVEFKASYLGCPKYFKNL